jgi:DNA-directed RNA polymerase subunit RPC12/RpoP
MNWHNLRENRCPKCSKDLIVDADNNTNDDYFYCECGFRISAKKFKSLVTKTIEFDNASHYRPEDEVPEY